MNYGIDANQAGNDQATTGTGDSNSTAAATDSSSQVWYDYYNKPGAADASADPSSCGSDANKSESDPQKYSKDDYYAYYAYYYGEDYAQKWLNTMEEEEEEEQNQMEEEERKKAEEGKKEEEGEEEKNTKGKDQKKGKDKDDLKRKAPDEPPCT